MKQVEVKVKVEQGSDFPHLTLSLNLNLFSTAGALRPLTPCRSPSIMLGHAVLGYPEFRDAGFTVRPVRISPLYG